MTAKHAKWEEYEPFRETRII